MPYKVVYINENDEKDTIEAEEFEYGENGIVRILIGYDGDADEDEIVKYIPIHRFIMADGIEKWTPSEEEEVGTEVVDEDEEEEEEDEEEET